MGKDILALNDEDISKVIKIELTQSDIIAAKVSQMEDVLDAERKELQAKREKLAKQVEQLSKQLVTEGQKLGVSEYGDSAKVIGDAFKKIGLKKTVSIRTDLESVKRSEEDDDNDPKVTGLKYVKATLVIVSSENRHYNTQDINEVIGYVNFNKEMLEIRKDLDATREEIIDITKRETEIRTALANTSRMERKMNAEFVKRYAEKNDSVRLLLEEKKD